MGRRYGSSGGATFRIEGIEPTDLAGHPEAVRRMYWRWVVELVLTAKDRELAAGLDRFGMMLVPIGAKTRRYRRSVKGPADPNAPPLQPAHELSRTRSLFRGRAFPDRAEFYWAFDEFSGASWGRILKFHARGVRHLPVRDVIGLSPQSTQWVRAQALGRWGAWLHAKQTAPGYVPPKKTAPVPKGWQIGQTKSPPRSPLATRNSQLGRTDLENFTFGIGASRDEVQRMIDSGHFTGFRQLHTFKPGTGPSAAGPKPPPPPGPAPAPKPAPKPKTPPKPAEPKVAPLDRIRGQVEAARLAQASVHGSKSTIAHRVDPLLPIGERIKAYTLGDAKIKAITEYHGMIAGETEKTIRSLQKEYDALNIQASKQNKVWQRWNEKLLKADRLFYKTGERGPLEEAAVQVDEALDRLTKTRKAYDAIAGQIKELRRSVSRRSLEAIRLDKRESVAFHASSADPGATSKTGPLHAVDSDDDRKTVDEAMEWLGRLVLDGSSGPWKHVIQLKVGAGKGYRAHHRGVTDPGAAYHVQIREGEDTSTVIHEYGHGIDARIVEGGTKVGERSKEFLKHRVGSEPAQKLKDLFPEAKYDEDEIGMGDEFDKAHLGDKRKAFYAGKDYGDRDSSEILSMGLELLYRDPVSFSQTDPEWFKYVVGVLDGSLR